MGFAIVLAERGLVAGDINPIFDGCLDGSVFCVYHLTAVFALKVKDISPQGLWLFIESISRFCFTANEALFAMIMCL